MAYPSHLSELPGPSLAISPLPAAAQLEVADGAHFDVVIIGSGAGGGTLARHLAPSGLKILV
ncbi:MAG: dehydrogenase, partial [Cyanobacteria bacterium]|nr:dehydrogenase [Cyanobacteria bacterium bin.275]